MTKVLRSVAAIVIGLAMTLVGALALPGQAAVPPLGRSLIDVYDASIYAQTPGQPAEERGQPETCGTPVPGN